ncbi:MAG: peptidoglycan DD-metalloendopeptidase family protein [Agarilytica sp.]
MLVAGLSVLLAGFTALPSGKAVAKRHTQTLELPIAQEPTEAVELHEERAPELTLSKHTVKVKSGDNLSVLFKRAGLNDSHMMRLLKANKESKRLASLYPGHTLEFYLTRDGKLHSLNYIIDRLNSFEFTKSGDTYDYQEHKREPDVQIAQVSAFITQSLYTAGIDAQLDDKLIMELADVFGWDVDFALDIRKGDHFKVVYEEKFLEGEKIGNGAIVAAEFTNQGETFQAVRYENARGNVSYYSPEGHSMRKDFLRAPVDFRRISSNFNPRRLHPVLKTTRPHRGIDYAAARGTPVWSSGNGRVVKAGYSKANGNYVVIQHGNSVQTKYLHLHKRYVKKGQKVKQKQKIGTVGSTGLATGPHLHYEFLINGVHRNPRTIINKLPKAKSIAANELARFIKKTRTQVALLNEPGFPSSTRFATAEESSNTKNL